MAKSFILTGKLSAKKRDFKNIVSDVRHAVFSVVRQRPMGNGQFQTKPLGSGFFVSPTAFVTCWHVIDSPDDPNQPDDRYALINNLDGQNSVIYNIPGGVGEDIHLFPELDFAIINCTVNPAKPYMPMGYACLPVGAEIGVAGYPLSTVGINPDGSADISGLVYRVAKGTATAVYRTNWNAGDGHPLLNTPVVEVNFFFVPGNSGGPIFDAENGRAFAYVKGLTTPKINEFLDTAVIDLPENVQRQYVTGIRAVYSIGLTLDRVREQLEQFGVSL